MEKFHSGDKMQQDLEAFGKDPGTDDKMYKNVNKAAFNANKAFVALETVVLYSDSVLYTSWNQLMSPTSSTLYD